MAGATNTRKTYTYDVKWESKTDHNGHRVGAWGSMEGLSKMKCEWCQTSFSIVTGFQAVKQHSKTAGHVNLCKKMCDVNQLRIRDGPGPSVSGEDTSAPTDVPAQPGINSSICLYSLKDAATSAELIWTLKCVKSHYPFASCDGIADVFREMFHKEGAVPDGFTIGSTKATYLLTEALCPFFREVLLKDMSNEYFSVLYDETTNNANRKELEFAVRYFSESTMQVMNHHLRTFFIGRATAEILSGKLFEALDEVSLPKKKVLMLGSDGPRVNIKVEKLVNEELINLGLKALADLGTCNIHTVHNAFLKGLEAFGMDASDFIVHLNHFFGEFPARREDFEEVRSKNWKKVPKHDFIKHVSSRWLTLEPAAERALEQLNPLRDYVFKFVPKNRPSLEKTKSYLRLRNFLRDPTLVPQLHFVIASAKIFTDFTQLFQRDEPLVHVIYKETETVAKKLMGRICKQDSLQIGAKEDALAVENLLPVEGVIVGDATESALNEVTVVNGRSTPKLSEKQRLTFKADAQKHYLKACLYILKNSVLNKRLAEVLICLNPEERLAPLSRECVVELAKSLPLDDVDTELLSDEWLLLSAEKETLPWKKTDEKYPPIDKYWAQFFILKTASGTPKYPTITKVVKAALALSHGNAYVERKFSESKHTLTETRASMSEKTMNAHMVTANGLKMYGNDPTKVPITSKLLSLARNANRSYKDFLEAERLKKEQEKIAEKEEKERKKAEEEKKKQIAEKKKKIEEGENAIKILAEEESEKRTLAEKLSHDAKIRLKKGTDKKNFLEISCAQAMLISAEAAQKEADEKKAALEKVRRNVEKRKSELINDFINPKKVKST